MSEANCQPRQWLPRQGHDNVYFEGAGIDPLDGIRADRAYPDGVRRDFNPIGLLAQCKNAVGDEVCYRAAFCGHLGPGVRNLCHKRSGFLQFLDGLPDHRYDMFALFAHQRQPGRARPFRSAVDEVFCQFDILHQLDMGIEVEGGRH